MKKQEVNPKAICKGQLEKKELLHVLGGRDSGIFELCDINDLEMMEAKCSDGCRKACKDGCKSTQK